jgi:hypothetical protein
MRKVKKSTKKKSQKAAGNKANKSSLALINET